MHVTDVGLLAPELIRFSNCSNVRIFKKIYIEEHDSCLITPEEKEVEISLRNAMLDYPVR